jgi:aminoglycoside phosphotransferase (APT) family kinase protein
VTESGVLTERSALITRLLREAGEIEAPDAVVQCDQREGGWSRFSHIARVDGSASGRNRRYVVRVKAPYGLFDTDLAVEYELFRALEPLDLPTPRAFGLHSDPENPFGGELFVMDFLPGRSPNVWRSRDHEALRADWEGARGVAADLVAYTARIHSIAGERMPARLPRSSFAGRVQDAREMYEEAELHRDPVLEEAFAWLGEQAPAPVREGLVHGDLRIGNTLIETGRVSAILDWELASIGDVRFDLGYIATEYMGGKHLRPKTDLLGAVAEREWFFAEYERLSAGALDRDAVEAFSVLGLVALMAMTYKGVRRYLDGQNTDFRRAWARFGLPGMREELTTLMRW